MGKVGGGLGKVVGGLYKVWGDWGRFIDDFLKKRYRLRDMVRSRGATAPKKLKKLKNINNFSEF